jgi:hypothetical protein
MASLPPEVIDTVLDHLHSDFHTLLSCSLVSTAWLPASRYHAFDRIQLTSSNLVRFLDVLHSPQTTLQPYIRHIHMGSLYTYRFNPAWLGEALPRLGRVLTSVRSLRLNDLHWSELCTRAFLASFDGRVTSLELVAMGFDEFDEVTDAIASFPLLHTLCLERVIWRTYPDPAHLPPPPAHLRALRLASCTGTQDLLNWFLCEGEGHGCSVERVDLGQVYDVDTLAVGRYLKALGESVVEIKVGFSGLNSGGDAGM